MNLEGATEHDYLDLSENIEEVERKRGVFYVIKKAPKISGLQ